MNGQRAGTSGDPEPPSRGTTDGGGYVDRRTAEGVQHERARRREAEDGPDDTSEHPHGEPAGWLQRLARLLRAGFGGRGTAGVVAGALLLAACTPAGDTAETAPDNTVEQPTDEPTDEAEATDDAVASEGGDPVTAEPVTCTDDEGDGVAFQDGVPTSQPASGVPASDLVEASLTDHQLGFRIITNRALGGPTGAPDATIEVHLQSTTQADETGVVSVRFPPSPGATLPVSVGPTMSDLSPVETVSSRVTKSRVAIIIGQEDLPVAPPFRWFVLAHEGAGAGDVCPNVTGFTADADLPTFPADAEGTPEAKTVTVTGVDYGYESIADQMPSGTRLEFTNTSEEEAHELALLRLTPDSPPVDELLQLPPDEGMAVTEMVGVSIALPGENGRVTKGDLLLDEPGRYVLLCAIPVGTPPAQIAEHPYGPPQGAPPPDSPPHLARGMIHVIEVTG